MILAFRNEATLCNANKGHDTWRFRPLGVPNEFVGRIDQPALEHIDWQRLATRANGIILMCINDRDLGDGRRGDLLANMPSDAQLATRVDRFWQLRAHAARTWARRPQHSPRLLGIPPQRKSSSTAPPPMTTFNW